MATGYEDIDSLMNQQNNLLNEQQKKQNELINQQTQIQTDELNREKEKIDKDDNYADMTAPSMGGLFRTLPGPMPGRKRGLYRRRRPVL